MSWDLRRVEVAHLTVSLYLFSSGTNAQGKSRALEGRRVSSKSPSRVRDGDKGVPGRNGRDQYFPRQEVIDLPSRQINDFDFLQKGNKKIELLSRPGPDDFFKHGWYDTASHRGFEETDSTGGKVDLSSEGGHF